MVAPIIDLVCFLGVTLALATTRAADISLALHGGIGLLVALGKQTIQLEKGSSAVASLCHLFLSESTESARTPRRRSKCNGRARDKALVCGIHIDEELATVPFTVSFLPGIASGKWNGVAAFGALLHGIPFHTKRVLVVNPRGR